MIGLLLGILLVIVGWGYSIGVMVVGPMDRSHVLTGAGLSAVAGSGVFVVLVVR